MEAYAIEEVSLYVQARDKFEELVVFLEGIESGRVEMWKAEGEIERRQLEVSRCLLEGYLNGEGEREVLGEVVGSEGTKRTHRKDLSREMESIFGPVKIWRTGYGQRGVKSLAPVDGHLNLPPLRHSHGVSKRLAEEVSKGSYDEAVGSVRRHTGARVSKQTALKLSEEAVQDFDAFYESRVSVEASKNQHEASNIEGKNSGEMADSKPTPSEAKVSRVLAMSADGKGVVMRPEGLRSETRKKAKRSKQKLSKRLSPGEKRGRKRMSTVAALYTITPYIRTATQVATDLAPTNEERPRRPRPTDKRVWASLEKSPRQVLTELFMQAMERDPEQQMKWVALVDGNEHQIRVFRELAAQYSVSLVIILDLMHVLEYLWKAAWAFFEEGEEEAQTWVSERLLRLLEGKASGVAAGMRRSATYWELEGKERKAVDTCANYLLKYKEFLRYDEYLAAGVPIGTGVIEGACRYLVKDRMDITGARWSLSGAEAVLKLRALWRNGDFDEYWRFHLAKEKERNHLEKYAQGLPALAGPAQGSPKLEPDRRSHLQLVR